MWEFLVVVVVVALSCELGDCERLIREFRARSEAVETYDATPLKMDGEGI